MAVEREVQGLVEHEARERGRERGQLVPRARQLPPGLQRYITLETTQGQMDGFFSQLPYKFYLEEVASVGD